MEPAAILIGAFEINVGGPLGALQHGEIRRAGIEPHIQNVVFLAPLRRPTRAPRACRQQFLRTVFVPGVGAFFFKPFHDIAQRFEIFEALSASLAVEDDDRHTPEALARDAPVRTLFNHFVHAVFAPGGEPFHLMNFLKRFLAERFFFSVGRLVHLDEPLLGGAEDYRIVAAPAVRVTVLVLVVAQQRAAIAEQLDNGCVSCEDILSLVLKKTLCENSFVIKRCVRFEPVFLSYVKVVGAMTGGGVNDSASLIERDMLGQHAWYNSVQEWVLKFHLRKNSARNILS